MKLTAESIVTNYQKNIVTAKDSSNPFELVGTYKGLDTYKKRMKLLCELFHDGDELYKSYSKNIKESTDKSTMAAMIICELCERIVKGNKKDDSQKAPEEKKEEPKVNINTLYITSYGFNKMLRASFQKEMVHVYAFTNHSIKNSPMSGFMNHLYKAIDAAYKNGYRRIATDYSNGESHNLFVFYLHHAITVYNELSGHHMDFVILKTRYDKVGLKDGLDYCVTGMCGDIPCIIQNHGENTRRVTFVLDDVRKIQTTNVYHNEICVGKENKKVPVSSVIKQAVWSDNVVTDAGQKRIQEYIIPIVSMNRAIKLEKHVINGESIYKMLKEQGIDSCLAYNYNTYMKPIKNKLAGYAKLVNFQSMDLTNYFPVNAPEVEDDKTNDYDDKDITTDKLPAKECPFDESSDVA